MSDDERPRRILSSERGTSGATCSAYRVRGETVTDLPPSDHTRMVAVEVMRIGRQDRHVPEALVMDVGATKVWRRRDVEIGIRRITAGPAGGVAGDLCLLRHRRPWGSLARCWPGLNSSELVRVPFDIGLAGGPQAVAMVTSEASSRLNPLLVVHVRGKVDCAAELERTIASLTS